MKLLYRILYAVYLAAFAFVYVLWNGAPATLEMRTPGEESKEVVG